ncbi:septation protein SepH [Phytoactinopolyspora limicola]|uniref:septation protein SepH n=1 Tax=Phytoactinopolyspora limicola TaxID=2715536 RepID=UPI001407D9EA|nr:septation protein SepH [Phytoactinopolyspora limicola]
MRELRLTAVSEDGAYFILSDGDEQYALRADERVHAAIRGDRARLGQLDIQLESQLRPREIQARIRAGESVDSVAAAATMPREKVERFAGPVLAEREHIAQRARQSNMRRVAGEGPVRTLEAAAADHVASVGAQPDTLTWDAWRAEDGRWRVQCVWQAEDTTTDADGHSALFSFDPSGRSVSPLDINARVVAGEARPEPEPQPEPEPVAAPEPSGPARLSVVQSPVDDDAEDTVADAEPLPFDAAGTDAGTDAQPVTGPMGTSGPDTRTDDTPDTVDPVDPVAPLDPTRRSRRTGRYGRPERRRREASESWLGDPAELTEPSEPADADTTNTDRLRLSDIANHIEVEDNEPPDDTPDELAPTAQDAPPTPPRRTGSSRSRRPSVPSWDEIMFGRRKND